MSLIHPSSTPQEVVVYNPILAIVFERFGLQASTSQMPLSAIEGKQCLDANFLVEILRVFDHPDTFDPQRFTEFPSYIILDYLYRTHRYYVDKRLLEIERSIDRLTLIYGQDHPLLTLLNTFFPAYSQQMAEHIAVEEDTLFPYVLHLLELTEGKGNPQQESIFSNYNLKAFTHLHEEDELDAQLGNLRKLILRRHPELTGLLPFMILTSQLDAFERDLYIHECIEDLVLVPQAKALEAEIFGC